MSIKQRTRTVISALLAAAVLSATPTYADSGNDRTSGGSPVMIAFVDSGIATRHISPDHVAEGVNYVFPENDTRDRVGHGTATAGLVLGSPDLGMEGVCPDAVAVPLVVVDHYPSGVVKNGGTEALVQAIYDAVDMGCRVINCSLSTEEDTEELRDAVAYAEKNGSVIVAAVGNDGPEGAVCYPAAYSTVLAVGSADGMLPADFSQDGADVLAESMNLQVPSHRSGSKIVTVSGTSYACAIVSGCCALLLEEYPDLSASTVRKAICRLATDILEPGYDERSGWGVLPREFEVPRPFPDIRDGWSREGISYVFENGLMKGTGDGLFDPLSPVTRGMIVTILWRMEGGPAVSYGPGFEDVSPDKWYYEAVRWAAGEGLVNGYGAARFGPEDSISREQAAAIIYRYITRRRTSDPGSLSADYDDSDLIASWALEAVTWAVNSGIITGTGRRTLSPKDTLTRAQAATVIMRLAGHTGA